ncbi:hypothetical protein ASD54_21795 [Rhizobium sp. Root149]|nr:hypothetical protein ASD54_21795 [Rhizobium sp. Root149]
MVIETKRSARRRAATSLDVAREAGVSQAAVSRAFSKTASIAPETRKRILAAAELLNYRPNLLARSLITNRTHTIGVAVGYMENQFYPKLLQCLSEALSRIGYRILLFTTPADADTDPLVEDVLKFKVDGLILASTLLSSKAAENCQRAGVPVLMVNRRSQAVSVSSVTSDNFSGSAAIANLLLAAGHKSFAYISGRPETSTSLEREKSFRETLKRRGMDAEVVCGNYLLQDARSVTRELLSRPNRPEALFYANDHMALAGLEVAKYEYGLSPGTDISIAGFDDIAAASWPSFNLTTYSQPIEQMTERIVDCMMRSIEHPDTDPEHIIVRGDLIHRSSTRRSRI